MVWREDGSLPSLIDATLDRDKIVEHFGKPQSGRKYGVVALTPSFKIAGQWEKYGSTVAKPESIDAVIETLNKGNCEATVIIVNRYDGIDLPDNTCRILIFDSVPIAANLADAYSDSCRGGSSISIMRAARSIEQGLGRSVRGEKDYSVIILTGAELVKMVRSPSTRQYFSPQTRCQIDIGIEIVDLAKEQDSRDTFNAFIGTINQCLRRDPGWKQFYTEQMEQTPAASSDTAILKVFEEELRAEQSAQSGNPREAVSIVQKLIDRSFDGDSDVGWYLQEMARYAFSYSKTESNSYQIAAHKRNRYVMRPSNGMVIDKISIISQKRIGNIIDWVSKHGSYEELQLSVEDILSRLEFGTKAERFEQGLMELGQAIGFVSQRPDREWKEGPDNLWAVRDGEFFVIECKSEVNLERSEINKDESGQMNNACAWFSNNYAGAKPTHILIIPTKKLNSAAGFNEPVIIIRPRRLNKLLKNVRSFFAEFASADLKNLARDNVQQYINVHALGVDDIRSLGELPT